MRTQSLLTEAMYKVKGGMQKLGTTDQQQMSTDNSTFISPKSFQAVQQHFWQSVSVGPKYVCCSCEQLWYKESVVSTNRIKSSIEGSKSWLPENEQRYICRTCNIYVKTGRTRLLGLDNNMSLPEVPDELQLHSLEERLVALRTPFMQMRELPRGRPKKHQRKCSECTC